MSDRVEAEGEMRRRARLTLADPKARVYPNAVALARSFSVHDDHEFWEHDH